MIPITRPYFDETEKELITKPLETGWVVQGPYVKEFEGLITAFTGAAHGVAVNSCTSGQFILSRVIDLQPGDEVIVPAFTWVSTANSVEFLGAKAVFCDIDPKTFNIDVSRIEALITSKTRAIYPVHLFGLCANMPEVMRLAGAYNLKVIEDCACGLGGRIDGKHCGTFGEGGVLSFHPRKSITTGEGGMIITRREEVATRSASLRDHGAVRTDYDRHHSKGSFLLTEYAELGYNYRMTDFQGALGVAQAKKLDAIMEIKQGLAKEYKKRIEEISWLRAPHVPDGYFHGYQAYVTWFKPEESFDAILRGDLEKIDALNAERNKVMYELEEEGIATRQGTHAVHIQKLYREKYSLKPSDFITAYAADRLSVALPFFPGITDDEIDEVFDRLKEKKV